VSAADATSLATLRQFGLEGLADSDSATRKRAARSLVTGLRQAGVSEAMSLFELEPLPEVYKWLGMALARAGGLTVVRSLQRKRNGSADPNARDWLLAAETVADPYTTRAMSERMLLSADGADKHEGAVRTWGLLALRAATQAELMRAAAESDDPYLRRWCLLSLHQHGIGLDQAVLIDNLSAGDYLLREWSLHSLVRFPTAAVQSRVLSIVDQPADEHPRVLEWAAHAAGAVDLHDPQIDSMLVDLHAAVADTDVQEACLAELGQRLNEPATEYLIHLCSATEDGAALAAMFSGRTPTSRKLPAALAREIDRASARIDPQNPGLRYFYQHLPVASGTRVYLERVVADPMNSVYLRGRLSLPAEEGDTMSSTEPMRVGVVVALKEEYDYLAEITSLAHAVHPVSRESYYLGQMSSSSRPIELIVSLVGRKGSSFAAVTAQKLLTDHAPEIIVSLGVSGALHPKDGHLADVVIGESSTAYFENFKAIDGDDGQFGFAAGTETFRSDAWLSDRAVRLDIEDPIAFRAWQAGEGRVRGPLNLALPAVLMGPIAAGPGVVASEGLKAWVRRLNRGFLAVDMESTGIAQVSWTDLGQARLLLVRGISDAADPSKDGLDIGSDTNYRRLAMQSAATYLLACLTSLAGRGERS